MSLSRSFGAVIAAILTGCLAAGCADDLGSAGPGLALAEAPAALGATYRLGIGDKLKINVFGEESLSGPVEVDAGGQIALPLAGEVPAQGKTIAELRSAVARRLADGYLKNPKVTIEITNYRPIYIHGEVKNGGEFPYKSGLRLRDAIAMAGGYTYRANQSYALVAREGQAEARVPASANLTILPGDNVRIPERFF